MERLSALSSELIASSMIVVIYIADVIVADARMIGREQLNERQRLSRSCLLGIRLLDFGFC